MSILKGNKTNNKGLTLVELIAVIGIMAVLIGLITPQFLNYVTRRRAESCASHREAVLDIVEESLYSGEIVLDGTDIQFSSVDFSTLPITVTEQKQEALKSHMINRCSSGGVMTVLIHDGIATCSCSCHENTAEFGTEYGDRVADLTAWSGKEADYGEADSGIIPTTVHSYTVTLKAEPAVGAANLSPNAPKEVKEGDTTKVRYTTADGYKFKEWKIEGIAGVTTAPAGQYQFTMPGNDVTCTAVFEKVTTTKVDDSYWPYPDDSRWDDVGRQNGSMITLTTPFKKFSAKVNDGEKAIVYVVSCRYESTGLEINYNYAEGPFKYVAYESQGDEDIIQLSGVVYNKDNVSKIASAYADQYWFSYGDIYEFEDGTQYVFCSHETTTQNKLPDKSSHFNNNWSYIYPDK